MREWLNPLAQKVSERIPELGRELEDAGIEGGRVEYVSKALAKASLIALLIFLASALSSVVHEVVSPVVGLSLSIVLFAFSIICDISRPMHMMKKRARRIEETLIFSLHAINIEMESGIKFPQALKDVADGDYGEFSHEMKNVLNDAQKRGLSKALERSAQRNPSKIYRRSIWQIINGLETGANVNANIKSIIEDLKRKQETEAARYGRSMEKQMTLYVMGGIVFPALAIVVLQTISTLGMSSKNVDESYYWTVLGLSLLVQFFFIHMIRFKKPTLLSRLSKKTFRVGGLIHHIRSTLDYAGNTSSVMRFSAVGLGVSILFGLVTSLVSGQFFEVEGWGVFFVSTSLALVSCYTYIVYKADSRGLVAAEYLPDSLRIMAANIQAGMPIDQALFTSARGDFPVLGDEIRLMGTDVMKNMSFENALERLKTRLKSDSLHMSVNLIGHGIRSGRGLSQSLFHIADILQDQEHIRQQITTQMQAIKTTVLILVMLSAPLLYSCSIVAGTKMSSFNQKLASTIPQTIMSQSWMKPSNVGVSPEFLNNYIIVNLLVTAVLGSVIIGLVSSGRVRQGLRYMLVMVLTSETLYMISRQVLTEKIGGAFT